MIERYQRAIKRIGGASSLLALPEQIKKALREARSLEAKTKILEAIADAMEGVRR